jgi:hypothetical protein
LDSLLIRRLYSRNILLRLVLFTAIAAGLLYWNLDFINDVYFRNQLTPTGKIVNGTIAMLFLTGMISIIASLINYMREESALIRFIGNIDNGSETPLEAVNKKSLIACRYHLMTKMSEAKTPINQSALASTLVASESTRGTLPKFINNILILTGVFGTVVSLSLALLGASDMLENSIDIGGMGSVIHGMSTALSTTITAIVCYIFFGYFLLKLNDVQTNLVSGIEQVTTAHLMPRFQIRNESVLYEFTGLIRSLQTLVQQMNETQKNTEKMEQLLITLIDQHVERTTIITDEMSAIKGILKHGFRLSKES